ncbi:MAG TPA: hypothetical protein VN256_24975 [Pyrinomonadaceae bacterium]|nr:hypothetical protein [Pyrinomonadaceae bacterium]
MSQALSGRTIALSGNAPVVPRLVWLRRAARPRPARRVFRALWLCLGLLCAAASTASAQQAQTVKSTQPIVCGGKNYQLRLVSAAAPIGGQNARAVGVVLTPKGGTESKVFCFYWMNAQSDSPTNRDDTTGKLGSSLKNYGGGQVVKFFDEAGCSSGDSQVAGINKLLGENVTGDLATLGELARKLKNEGVAVDDAQVENASNENLNLFEGLSDDVGFATAIRRYVSNVLAAEEPTEDSRDELKLKVEISSLQSINTISGVMLGSVVAKEDSFFGGAPGWLISSFIVTLSLSLAALAFVVWGFVRPAHQGASPGNTSPPALTVPPQISEPLAAIINTARDRRRRIEQAYPETQQAGAAQNQKGKGQDNLADAIVSRLVNVNIVHRKNHPPAKRAIEAALNEGKDKARQRADEWYGAYTELQNQMEELQKSLSLPGDGTPPPLPLMHPPQGMADVPLVFQEMAQNLHKLTTKVDGVQVSVDSLSGKLTMDTEAVRALQNIWAGWHGQEYAGEQTDALVIEVGEVADLYHFLKARYARPGAHVKEIKRNLEFVQTSLEEIRQTHLREWLPEPTPPNEIVTILKSQMSAAAEVIEEYKTIKESLREYSRKERKVSETVTLLINERSVTVEKLGSYHHEQTFVEAIDAVVANYGAITSEVRRVLPDVNGTVRDMVFSLATEYQNVKPEAERARRLEIERDNLNQQLITAQGQLGAGKELVEEIALQLNFKTDGLREDDQAITGTLERLRRERDASVYLQLRLGLSSALIALEKETTADNTSEEQRDVIEALHLDKVKKGVKELLGQMEEYSGQQLWDKALSEAFGDKWLHYLIRADLLLRTYYGDLKEYALLRRAVSVACSAMLAALSEFQVEVVEVGLFEKRPEGMEPDDVYAGLRNLPTVRDKVRSKMQTIPTGDVVVDITSFPYFVKGVQENPGRASLANPSAWLQY